MIAVIVYHLRPVLLPGGFAGVDCFFVISGFVVTSAILRAESANAWHDLKRFWRRRWMRIMPPLIVCVLVTTIVTGLFLTPVLLESYRGTIRTGLAALVGVGNVYLLRTKTDYFQSDQSINVFAHTWSLGVEEQYYVLYSLGLIVLPVLLLRGQSTKRFRFLLVAIATVASFFIFLRSARTNSLATYFLLPMRFWELGVGGLIGMIAADRSDEFLSKEIRNGIQIVSLILLAVSFGFPRPSSSFPVLTIVTAVAASGALVFTGDMNGAAVSQIISTRWVVAIGLISYSLYLWHWPVITLFRLTAGADKPITIFAVLSVTAVLAVLSYHFIEQPFRNSHKRTGPYPIVLVGGFAAAAIVGVLVQKYPGAIYLGSPIRWTDWGRPRESAYAPGGRIRESTCLLKKENAVPASLPAACVAPELSRPISPRFRLLSVGDSFSFADWPMFLSPAVSRDYSLRTLAHNGCSAVAEPDTAERSCLLYWKIVPGIIRSEMRPGDVVFLSFYWPVHAAADYQYAIERIHTISDAARSTGAHLVIQAPIPRFAQPGYMCIPEWFRAEPAGCEIKRRAFEDARARALAVLLELKARDPEISVWDPIDELCSPSCRPFARGRPVFRDWTHFSYAKAVSMGPGLKQFLDSVTTVRTY